MLTGILGSCNLCLAGNQTDTSIWSSCSNRGFYTLAYRRCTCLCTFCNNNFSEECAFNKCRLPFYSTNTSNSSGPTTVSFETYSAVRNDGYPFMWNFLPYISSGTGTVTITTTSPVSITRSNPIYGYEISQFSNNSSTVTVNASLSSGGLFGGWRVNSGGGIMASTSTSFSPGWNTSYSDKSGLAHYKNIYQFYASATFMGFK